MPKITKLSTALIEANFHWTYARIYTDADGGLYGTGEGFCAPALYHIIQEFEPLLLGEDFNNVEKLVEKMRWAASGAGSIGGIVWNAISAIETALWDLKGKYLGVPVYQLLGGAFRKDVRIYVDCHASATLESLTPLQQPYKPSWETSPAVEMSREEIIEASAARAKAMVDEGYTALKFDLDLPGTTFDSAEGYPLTHADIDWMVALSGAIRGAIGTQNEFAMDAHWRYRPNDILQVAHELETFKLMWLEDPVPPDDFASLNYLRQHTRVPIGTGEHLQLRQGFWQLIVNRLIDIPLPDVQKAGGLAESKKIADMAAVSNMSVAYHMIGSPLALMASAHVAASIPNFKVCEFHAHDVPFFSEIAQGGTPWFRPGWVTLTDAPGLGIELDDRVGERYKQPGTGWFA
ncbi:MAG: mandelate racemase/muconate lactonizing enzyme family protein [Chloroflexota bacterium]|nr:mandelate racemase/muconate lactonizing enzyme family protein [Chloroflexota bacterium]